MRLDPADPGRFAMTRLQLQIGICSQIVSKRSQLRVGVMTNPDCLL
ncbi:hypothetical protein ALP83_102009 [Pseudomonas syringae pv. actinidiae]|uniref:Uncharacterized protein n=1 Tax=Pseudomonas syringae pv. actinidiae TaxID=103796 RepID=A0A7Z6ULS2_PSESF|nr:hypothetical protein ALQ15_115420 [Pseudomonas syringae pv. actinidiae]RMR60508.1 hypothetical protein ALP83_102009 [Pseudomonas syringae pv. actinidiae]